jgi:hypothetical protein
MGCATGPTRPIRLIAHFRAVPSFRIPANAKTFAVAVFPQNSGDDVAAVARASERLQLRGLERVASGGSADLIVRVTSPGFSEHHDCNQGSSEGLVRKEGPNGDAQLHHSTTVYETCNMRGVMSASWAVVNRDGPPASDKGTFFRQTKMEGGNPDGMSADLSSGLMDGYLGEIQHDLNDGLESKTVNLRFLFPGDARYPALEAAADHARRALHARSDAGPGKPKPDERAEWKQAETTWLSVRYQVSGEDSNYLGRLLDVSLIEASLFLGEMKTYDSRVQEFWDSVKQTSLPNDEEAQFLLGDLEALRKSSEYPR